MPITRSTNTTYTLLNATVSDNGTMNTVFNVTVDSITQFTLTLTIPATAVPSILDVSITDGKTIRENLTNSIYNYFVTSGEIVGIIT